MESLNNTLLDTKKENKHTCCKIMCFLFCNGLFFTGGYLFNKYLEIEIEKGIYLGGRKILDNTCISISGNLVNKNKSFEWDIKKKI